MNNLKYTIAVAFAIFLFGSSVLRAQTAPENIDLRIFPVGTFNSNPAPGEIFEVAFKANASLNATVGEATFYFEAPTGLFNGSEVFDIVEENLGTGVNLIYQGTFQLGVAPYSVVSFVMSGNPISLSILPLNEWRHAFTVTMTGATTLGATDLVVADENSELYGEFLVRSSVMAIDVSGSQYNELFPIFQFPVLPLDLISFEAIKLNEKSSLLKWSTVNELNSSHFIVQSSIDNKNWNSIGNVKAAGDSPTIENYSFIDENVYNGRDARLQVYYRLVMIDFDGEKETSPIRSVVFGSGDITNGRKFVAYPNPASDGIHVEWNSDIIDNPTMIELFDTNGKHVYSQKVAENTHQEYIDFSGSTIKAGLYFMRILSGEQILEYKPIMVAQP